MKTVRATKLREVDDQRSRGGDGLYVHVHSTGVCLVCCKKTKRSNRAKKEVWPEYGGS